MALRLRTDSFRSYLRQESGAATTSPSPTPAGLCVLSGQILRRNIKEFLNREGIATSPLADFTTIEELASDLLEPTNKPSGILAEGIRDRLIEDILSAADPNNDNRELREFSAGNELREDERNALEHFAIQLPYEEEAPRELLLDELDDYLRWTDATRDTATGIGAIGSLSNGFARQQSFRSTDFFRGIVRLIEGEITALSLDANQSRSHLVSSARDVVSDQWPAQFEHVEWMAVAGISVFDSPTLRFLEELADHDAVPSVEVFVNKGSFEYSASRFEALECGVVDESNTTSAEDMESSVAQSLFDATQGHATSGPKASFIEAPTDQRAVERVASDIQTLLQEGVDSQDILVVAPDAGSYQSLLESAFEMVGIPLFVETRQPIADIPAYRCFRTFVEVVESIAADEPISYGALVDPIRLGYCQPGSHGTRWPIAGRDFTRIEQELHRKQRFYNQRHDRYEDRGLLIEEWRELIDDIPAFTADWDAVNTYLDTAEELADNPPGDGDELQDYIGPFLGTYVYQTVDHRRSLYTAPAVDTTRTVITQTHPTSLAERVRSRLDAAGSQYDQLLEMFDSQSSWDEANRAFSSVLGSDSYGERHIDGQAVPVVDAGNAFFRNASHIFVLGMNADEFPGAAGSPTFLPATLRDEVYQEAMRAESPYPHLDSRASAYGEALDFYQATLLAATSDASISLIHTYRDDQGNDIAWSSFVDLFDVESEGELAASLVERVSVGEWLPRPRVMESGTEESWGGVVARTAPRERLRMLLYQANRTQPESEPVITRSDLEIIVATLDPVVLHGEILPRLQRYQDPPTTVQIEESEPAFEEVSFCEVAGGPLRPHELDLNGQCGLKYYYYQFLYNFEGSVPERDIIPTYYSQASHYRLGELPYLVRENYADPRYVEKWKQIVTTLLPSRQSSTGGLLQFDSDDELRKWVIDHDVFEEFDLGTIYDNLRAEKVLVEREVADDVQREWEWREGSEFEIDGHRLKVPPYRLDTLFDGDSEYVVPIFFTRFSNRANSALKHCHSAIWEADETTHELCLHCDDCDSCDYNSKYVLDHRMLAGYEHETTKYDANVVGIGLQEQFAGPDNGDRVVAMRTGIIPKFHPFDDDELFETLRSRGYSDTWHEKADTWRENFLTQATDLDPDSPVELTANLDLVNRDDCLNCVYRDLCMVPSDRGGT